jgi:hypothetical protein
VVFDEVGWGTGGGFDTVTGDFVVGREAKFHFAAGVWFLAPGVRSRQVELLFCKNGKPFGHTDAGSSVQQSRLGHSGALEPRGRHSGPSTGGSYPWRGCRPGGVFETYVPQSFGEPACPTVRHPGSADEDGPADPYPVSLTSLWHA